MRLTIKQREDLWMEEYSNKRAIGVSAKDRKAYMKRIEKAREKMRTIPIHERLLIRAWRNTIRHQPVSYIVALELIMYSKAYRNKYAMFVLSNS